MTRCLFVSDLHGRLERYEKLLAAVDRVRPRALFVGGDLLPGLSAKGVKAPPGEFLRDYLFPELASLRERLGAESPRIMVILGNDDGRSDEEEMAAAAGRGLCDYVHGVRSGLGEYTVYGYSYVNPTPFWLKDWERYDVSRYVDPGAVSPEEGWRRVPVPEHEVRYGTIAQDLEELTGVDDLTRAVMLFHAPPYGSDLDRAALDGKMVDHVPLDLHVGSIAIERFIKARQPLLTLHGHVHESTRLTGNWRQRWGRTWMFNGSHDGRELALIEFDLEKLDEAERHLL